LLRNKGVLLIGLIVVTLFFYGAVQLILLRLETGDVYPPYSSLRSDPLGTKALFESLQICCGLKVERNHEPFVEIANQHQAVVFFLGISDSEFDNVPESLAKDFRGFIENGGRLVFTFLPKNETSLPAAVKKAIEKQKKEKDKKEEEIGPKMVSLTEEWGFEFANSSLPQIRQATARLKDAGLALPPAISCHTSLYFRNLGASWNVMYEREGKPVLMERELGKGTIVLSALSFFLSNEAMLKERHSDLLAWITGNHSEVIFDEYHHGLAASPGVAALGRKYHLEWLFFGILVLAILFLWKSSVPLVPYLEEENVNGNSEFAKGKESAEGLTNLLRRNISLRQILSVCYQEWKKSQGRQGHSKDKIERINSIMRELNELPPGQRNLQSTYNRVSEVLKERG
jgi:hypothetical protein